ncbi:MAG TPA: hypothetical protein VN905_08905 [Candidatus Binatia bacterium]|nr:hypothetical protein [Candidatus Binatia bacterium]
MGSVVEACARAASGTARASAVRPSGTRIAARAGIESASAARSEPSATTGCTTTGCDA